MQRTMCLSKKCLLTVALVVAAFVAFSGYQWLSANAEQQRADDELAKLKKKTRDQAEQAFKAWHKPGVELDEIPTTYLLAGKLLNAELEISEKKEQRIAAHEAHLQRMKDWEKWVRMDIAKENARTLTVGFFRLEAELLLAKERSK